MLAHGVEQLGPCRGERVCRFLAQALFEFIRLREDRAVLVDKSAERAAKAFGSHAADEQRKMDVAAGFVPRAEGAGCDVIADAFS